MREEVIIKFGELINLKQFEVVGLAIVSKKLDPLKAVEKYGADCFMILAESEVLYATRFIKLLDREFGEVFKREFSEDLKISSTSEKEYEQLDEPEHVHLNSNDTE